MYSRLKMISLCSVTSYWHHFQTKLVTNQPYDESLDVPDAEEVASVYTPSPRLPPPQGSHPADGEQRGNNSQDNMTDPSDDDLETGVMENKASWSVM